MNENFSALTTEQINPATAHIDECSTVALKATEQLTRRNRTINLKLSPRPEEFFC
ncbi:MAG: hypothetical protein IJ685_03470 [Selenomonadaceae bacterium]|nr:hypothetical protein [Selenomonadaceae bacterium]